MTNESDSLGLERLDGARGPALQLSREASATLVRTAMHREAASRRRRRQMFALAAAATLALVGGGATAAVRFVPSIRTVWLELTGAPPEREPSGERVRATAPESGDRAARSAVTNVQANEAVPSAPERGPASAGPPVQPDRTERVEPHLPARESASGSGTDAALLLTEANRLRGAGSYREADARYREILARHPGSSEAYAARVSAASLRVSRLADPGSALRLYSAAYRERPRGTLAPEALYGIAEAHRALGDPAAERRTLEEFLREFPAAAMADSARRRLTAP